MSTIKRCTKFKNQDYFHKMSCCLKLRGTKTCVGLQISLKTEVTLKIGNWREHLILAV